jgi:hypothetical protein
MLIVMTIPASAVFSLGLFTILRLGFRRGREMGQA